MTLSTTNFVLPNSGNVFSFATLFPHFAVLQGAISTAESGHETDDEEEYEGTDWSIVKYDISRHGRAMMSVLQHGLFHTQIFPGDEGTKYGL